MKVDGDRLARWTGFLVLWGLVGFATGTATLMGPVRWITNVVRWLGASQQVEGLVVNGVIAAFVLGSFLIAVLLGRWIRESDAPWVRLGVPSATALLAGGALWLWLSPGTMIQAGPAPREPEAPFTIGAYPDAHRMRQLRAVGYTGVISLLHPAVVPFEPKLLGDEREAAADAGLEFIHAPMLPWVSSNEEALETIRRVARRDTGYFYIHCYLGRDRVRVAARALREMGVEVDDWTPDGEVEGYSLARVDSLRRGPVRALPEGIYLVPFPDRQEYFSYVLNGGIESVVSLLDPEDPDEGALVEREEGWLADYQLGIDYRHYPVPPFPADPCRLRALADSIRALPRPVAVHGVSTAFTRSNMLFRALQSEPVYPEDFARGDVVYAGDSIYAGPAPIEDEISDYLAAGGLGSVVSLLDPSDADDGPELERIRAALEGRAGLAFESHPLPEGVEAADPRVRRVASRVRALPRPVYVHGGRSPDSRIESLLAALREAGVAPRCGPVPGAAPVEPRGGLP